MEEDKELITTPDVHVFPPAPNITNLSNNSKKISNEHSDTNVILKEYRTLASSKTNIQGVNICTVVSLVTTMLRLHDNTRLRLHTSQRGQVVGLRRPPHTAHAFGSIYTHLQTRMAPVLNLRPHSQREDVPRGKLSCTEVCGRVRHAADTAGTCYSPHK